MACSLTPRKIVAHMVIRISRLVAVLAALLTTTTVLSAQEARRCDPEERVRTVRFNGSPAFGEVNLAATVVTQPPATLTRWFGVGEAPCADTLEIRRDALRLAVLHRSAGWFEAEVVPVIGRTPNGLDVHFLITPGREAILDTMLISGLPEAAEGRAAYDAPLRRLEGLIFDRARVDTTIDNVLLRLRNRGFARARRPESKVVIDTANASVQLQLDFSPGPQLTVGQIKVEVQGVGAETPRADSAAVMRLIDLRAGELFRADDVLEAQRDLYRTEAFRLVFVDTATSTGPDADSTIDLRIVVAEAQTRNARVGAGWATQDCIRVQGRLADRSFLGVGRRAEVAVRASKLGVGEPTDIAPALCSNALRQDPFSEQVNYYVGTTLSSTRLFGYQVAPTVTVYSERRGEPFAYLRETSVGTLAEVSRAIGRRSTVTGGFQYENGRTLSDPVQACSRFGQCTPEDIEQSLFGRGVTILSIAATHDRTNDIVNPRNGSRVRAELRAGRTASPLVSQVNFFRASSELSAFYPFAGGVFGARLQVARAFAPGVANVTGRLLPPQERLFGGGQNSVRGYQQNLLGPLVYSIAPTAVDTLVFANDTVFEAVRDSGFLRVVPRGGSALTVLNVEYRRAVQWVPLPLQLALFVDAGNVWEVGEDVLRFSDLRATPGVGVRVGTPIGAFRMDIGYRPYEPNAGPAYMLLAGKQGSGGRIVCVSPGNRVSIAADSPSSPSDCPATYRPPTSRGVLSRLAFHFGLGQAF